MQLLFLSILFGLFILYTCLPQAVANQYTKPENHCDKQVSKCGFRTAFILAALGIITDVHVASEILVSFLI